MTGESCNVGQAQELAEEPYSIVFSGNVPVFILRVSVNTCGRGAIIYKLQGDTRARFTWLGQRQKQVGDQEAQDVIGVVEGTGGLEEEAQYVNGASG